MLTRFNAFAFLLFLFQSHVVYKVTNNQTNAYCHSYNRDLHRGDTVSQDDYIQFHGNKGILCLVNDAGTFAIKPGAHHVDAGKTPSEFAYLVKQVVGMTNNSSIAAGRAGGYDNAFIFSSKMRRYDSDSTALLVIDTLRLDMPYAIVNGEPGYHFLLNYSYQGSNATKNLSWVKVAGSWKLQLTAVGVPHNTDILAEIVQQAAGSNEQEPIAKLHIKFMEGRDMTEELRLIRKTLSKGASADDAQIKSAVYAYLRAYYGRPEDTDFENHIYPNISH